MPFLINFFWGGFPYSNRLQKKGTLILTFLLENLETIKPTKRSKDPLLVCGGQRLSFLGSRYSSCELEAEREVSPVVQVDHGILMRFGQQKVMTVCGSIGGTTRALKFPGDPPSFAWSLGTCGMLTVAMAQVASFLGYLWPASYR